MVIASLVDAGTMTADFTRFSHNGRQAVAATLAAFPVGQLVSALIGILVVSAGFAAQPAINGGMFVGILAAEGSFWPTVTAVFVVLNLAAVCSHCLYNGAMGWSQATGAPFRTVAAVLGVIGLVAAGIGVWSLFTEWLDLLGVIIPPIGAVIIVSLLARGYSVLSDEHPPVRWAHVRGVDGRICRSLGHASTGPRSERCRCRNRRRRDRRVDRGALRGLRCARPGDFG